MISSKMRAIPRSLVSLRSSCRNSRGCSSGARLWMGSTSTAAISSARAAMVASASGEPYSRTRLFCTALGRMPGAPGMLR